MIFKVLNSPHQSERIHGNDAVKLIVAHTPEGGYTGMINYIAHPGKKCWAGERRVSYHMLIKKDGTECVQFVPWTNKAWHAGAMNSLTDGIAVEGYAYQFSLQDKGTHELAKQIARRLISRGLKPQWTTDPSKGGFCRHADLQSDRKDPTPDLAEWLLFVDMVKAQHAFMSDPKPWPTPVPMWYWTWARWRLGVGEFKGMGAANPKVRPGAPVPPPGISWAPGGKHYWAWKRLKAQQDAARV